MAEGAPGEQLAADLAQLFGEVSRSLAGRRAADRGERGGVVGGGDQVAVVPGAGVGDDPAGAGRPDAAFGCLDGAAERLSV